MEKEDKKETRNGMTQREVATILGISRSRVYQIEKTAIKKLRKKCLKVGITRKLLMAK